MSRVESAAPVWRKAGRCDNGACVEVAFRHADVAVRDNTQPAIHLSFDSVSWRGLLHDLRGGRLNG